MIHLPFYQYKFKTSINSFKKSTVFKSKLLLLYCLFNDLKEKASGVPFTIHVQC